MEFMLFTISASVLSGWSGISVIMMVRVVSMSVVMIFRMVSIYGCQGG